MADWRRTQVANDGTHHLLEGAPLYSARFASVMKFHEPGLAPVADASGAYHIDVNGRPAYCQRYRRTFGFYEGVAAVAGDHGWQHVRPNGEVLAAEKFAWCGNMQGGRVTVRAFDGSYFHLRPDGRAAYEARYRYAGDYRDGAACVRRSDGQVVHIDVDGQPLSDASFLDLDVFHKGFARARDAYGWFHCDRQGRSLYPLRFATVEPFYNGHAYCETHDGRRIILNERGEVVHLVWDPRTPAQAGGPVVLLVGNVGSGKSMAGRELAAKLGWPHLAIDECRRYHGDGSSAGEAAAWGTFLRVLSSRNAVLAEFSGSGPFAHLVRHALAGRRFRVLWFRATTATCLARLAGNRPDVPYPDFGVPLVRLVGELGERLDREMSAGTYWRGDEVERIDAEAPAAAVAAKATATVAAWLGSAVA